MKLWSSFVQRSFCHLCHQNWKQVAGPRSSHPPGKRCQYLHDWSQKRESRPLMNTRCKIFIASELFVLKAFFQNLSKSFNLLRLSQWPTVGCCHFHRKQNRYPLIRQSSLWSPRCCRNPDGIPTGNRANRLRRCNKHSLYQRKCTQTTCPWPVQVAVFVVAVWNTFRPIDFVSLVPGVQEFQLQQNIDLNMNFEQFRPVPRLSVPRINGWSTTEPLATHICAQEQARNPPPWQKGRHGQSGTGKKRWSLLI